MLEPNSGDGGNRTHERFPPKLGADRLAVQGGSPRSERPVRQGATGRAKCGFCGAIRLPHLQFCWRCGALAPSSGKQTGDIPVNAERVSEGRLPR